MLFRSGIFACGNVLHVHDLVDFVSEESVVAGKAAAEYIKGERKKSVDIVLTTDGKIRYTVPQHITCDKDTKVYFRVGGVYENKKITVRDGDKVVFSKKKPKLVPAEMESVTLKGDVLSGLEGRTLDFSLED